ncbi:unnamed protein product [Mytilus coruscus]|uniref:B box-type domain-containing protein n=1 Tax=Mytilus coruscus TaxID=42192 RepID=A0A6J8AI74_MYTCO|nr:unnamed protein product [Mytilus coruscus]
MNNVRKIWADVTKNEDIRCEVCMDRGTAVGFCKDCARPIDRQCKHYHEKILLFHHHTTFDIRTGDQNFKISDFAPKLLCKLHINQPLAFYCSSLNELLCRECTTTCGYDVESVEQFLSLLDSLNDTKRLIEEILFTHPNLPEHTELTTMITWIDVSLKLNREYDDFTAVPLLPDLQEILGPEMSLNQVNVKCSEVRAKIEGLKRDMRLELLSNNLEESEPHEQQLIGQSLPTSELSDTIQHIENSTDSIGNNEHPVDVAYLQEAHPDDPEDEPNSQEPNQDDPENEDNSQETNQDEIDPNSFEDLHPH